MGLLIYHLGCQTEHIPTGFVSVAISGGFGENLANVTGLSVVHTFEAVEGSRGSVSAPAVSRVMSGAPERNKNSKKI